MVWYISTYVEKQPLNKLRWCKDKIYYTLLLEETCNRGCYDVTQICNELGYCGLFLGPIWQHTLTSWGRMFSQLSVPVEDEHSCCFVIVHVYLHVMFFIFSNSWDDLCNTWFIAHVNICLLSVYTWYHQLGAGIWCELYFQLKKIYGSKLFWILLNFGGYGKLTIYNEMDHSKLQHCNSYSSERISLALPLSCIPGSVLLAFVSRTECHCHIAFGCHR